jgi:hypothetical protein
MTPPRPYGMCETRYELRDAYLSNIKVADAPEQSV